MKLLGLLDEDYYLCSWSTRFEMIVLCKLVSVVFVEVFRTACLLKCEYFKTMKIASVGVQLKKWVSLHGMAININNDLSIFEHIVPCGLKDVVITSVQKETGKPADMNAVKEMLQTLCKEHWM